MSKRKYLLFLVLLAHTIAQGQNYVTSYQHIGIKEGLSGRHVNGLHYDDTGFLWINTIKALQRYDGYDFKKYPLDLDKYDINSINQIGKASDNWLWIYYHKKSLLKKELIFFNTNTNEVLTSQEWFGDEVSNQLNRLLNNCKYCYLTYDSENFYFTENNDLIIVDLGGQSNRYKIRDHVIDDTNKLYVKLIDDEGKIWIRASETDDFYIVDIETENIEAFKFKESQYSSQVIKLKEEIYITNLKADETGNSFMHISNINNESEPILKYKKNSLLIGIIDGLFWFLRENTLMVYNLKDQLQFSLEFEEDEVPIIRENNLNPLMKGPSGKIFMKNEMGLYIFDIGKSPFKTYFTKNKSKPLPFENSIRGINTDDNNIYVNVEFGGLVKIPKDTAQRFSVIFQPKENLDLYNGRPLLTDSSGQLCSGHSNSISKWNPKWEERRFDSRLSEGPLNKANACWTLWEDPKFCIWAINTNNVKIICRENSENYTNAELGFPNKDQYVYHIKKDESFDQNRVVWWSTGSGLFSFHYDHKKVINQYNRHQTDEFHLDADIVYHVHIDSIGDKWIATNNGLIHWEKKTNKKTTYNQEDGFLNEVIYAVYEDDFGRLWMSSDLGIIRFNKSTKDVHTYLPDDGIAQEEFNRISHHRSQDGTIYFGGLNGITAFNPKDFNEEKKEHEKVVLSDFQTYDGKEEQLVNKLEEISKNGKTVFKPSDKFIKLKFTFPTYDQYNKPLFAWKVAGVFDDWTYQKENTLQFGSLPYGNHNLTIKAQDDNGGWSPNELIIGIKVVKPFYLQTWFLILSAIALISAISLYIRSRLVRFKKEKAKLEREISKATEQILSDKNKLEKQAEELSQLEKLKSRFFANVSHELRTPLSLMIGPIKRVKNSKLLNDENKKLLSFVERNSIHLKKLVNEILDLSKLESGKLEVLEEAIDFYPYIKNHISQFYSSSSYEGLRINTIFPDQRKLSILIDKLKFEKIINNFISNAIKFTPSDGKISITITEHDATIKIAVEDTGRGIHEDDIDHIFDRFYQSKHGEVKQEGGTGIGLSLCSELAELMRGRVWAQSELGVGTTMFYEFPKKVAEKVTEGDIPIIFEETLSTELDETVLNSDNRQANKKKSRDRILIVEDNAELREYYSIILSQYELILKENGKEGLDFLMSTKDLPDIIITDLMMPIMNGMELLSAIKSDDKMRHLPVIMLTAKTNRNTKIGALRIGVDDYITKPFDDEELLVRIDNLLSYSRAKKTFITEEIDKGGTTGVVISKQEQEWLVDLEMYVIKNISNELLSVDLLGKTLAMSASTLRRQVKKLTGLSPSLYLTEHKLNHARSLLESKRYRDIATVAQKAGYRNNASFSRAFKNRFGVTPSELYLS